MKTLKNLLFVIKLQRKWLFILGMVVIAHRLSTIQNADKIVILEGGSIQEEGTHKELMENNGLYFNLYNKQDIVSGVNGENII